MSCMRWLRLWIDTKYLFQILLTALVNKLGDSSPKVRSKASQSLNGVLKVHPAMKGVVVEEVERLLFR